MNNKRFNYAAVFSIMALLVYAFFALMGLVYWKKGAITLPVIITLVGIGVVLGCLYVMCIGKESRWRIGRIGEVLFGLVILATFIAAALPFTNFAKVVERQEDIKGRIDTLLTSAKNLDAAYDVYVADRIQKYESQLNLVSKGKKVRPSDYKKLLAGASGDTDSKKIVNLSKSLRRQLLPDSRDSICKQRMEWLNRAQEMSVWNILLPQNINKIANEVDDYVQNYVDLSSTIRAGETVKPFAYESLNNDLGELEKIYSKFSKPSALSLIMSLIGFLIMLLPYLVAQRSLAKAKSSKQTRYE